MNEPSNIVAALERAADVGEELSFFFLNKNIGVESRLSFRQLLSQGPLVEPDWPRLASEVLRQALAVPRQLAKWALKTAIMMDRNTLTDDVIDGDAARDLGKDGIAGGAGR